MSRLIVKGLPIHFNDEELRKHFQGHGEITDSKVMRKTLGTTRGFGFVGFKKEEDAEKCLKYFNNSFINTSQIQVELAKSQKEIESSLLPFKKRRTLDVLKEKEKKFKKIVEKLENKTKKRSKEIEKVKKKEIGNEKTLLKEVNEQENDENLDLNKNENETKKNCVNSVEQQILETGRLFIRNISYETSEEDFRNFFLKFGKLDEVHIVVDKRTGNSKGFVYIQYENCENALEAYKEVDKQVFQGRILHILPSEKKKNITLGNIDLKNLPLKKQREIRRRQQASRMTFNWNSLYMNNDAILDSVASNMNINKSELIDVQDSNSAVKQALAEAHVIEEVKLFFQKRGIILDDFRKKDKDDKIILFKNFAYGTTVEDLRNLLSSYGKVKRIIMPKMGTIAIVQFEDLTDAKKAFSCLCYRKLKNNVIYLEKGPKGLFENYVSDNDESISKEETIVPPKISGGDLLTTGLNDDDNYDGSYASVFVKNLNFKTTDLQLKNVFSSIDGYLFSSIKKKTLNDPSRIQKSLGFGFVEFSTIEQARSAISTMNGYVLDGHALQLSLSERKPSYNQRILHSNNKRKVSNTLIVKNLPFESTKKYIYELFGAYGLIKSVRLPRKFDKLPRGFAFVEFSSTKESDLAMKKLDGVHLLGRKLILDFANDDQVDPNVEIEKMISKVRDQVSVQNLISRKLFKNSEIDFDAENENDENENDENDFENDFEIHE